MSEFNKFKPRLKALKNWFQFSTGLDSLNSALGWWKGRKRSLMTAPTFLFSELVFRNLINCCSCKLHICNNILCLTSLSARHCPKNKKHLEKKFENFLRKNKLEFLIKISYNSVFIWVFVNPRVPSTHGSPLSNKKFIQFSWAVWTAGA